MVDQKYACLVNFPIRHAFEHVMLFLFGYVRGSVRFESHFDTLVSLFYACHIIRTFH